MTARRVEFFEGCLSLTGLMALVPRASHVRVDCLDHNGEPSTSTRLGGMRAFCSMRLIILNGGLYIDRMYSRSLMPVEQYNRHWKDKSIPNVREELGIE